MAVYELIPESGQFYKVNLHAHTNISDGEQTPEQVKEIYKSMGYSAVAFTDHEVLVDHKDLCDGEFIALHGYEVAIKADESRSTGLFMPVYHFNFVAKKQDNLVMPMFYKNNKSFPGNCREWAKNAKYDGTIDHTAYYNKAWLERFLKNAKEHGFLISYNHPQWSLQSVADIVSLDSLHAIEAINGGTAVFNDNTSIHFEQLLRMGKNIVPNGGDDNHENTRCGLGWTMIKADTLSYDALIDGYEKGNCYASEGPEIKSLVLKDNKICIKTSDAKGIYLFTEGRFLDYKFDTNYAEFDYTPENFGRYFRLEVQDASGKRAFSNAYYTNNYKKEI